MINFSVQKNYIGRAIYRRRVGTFKFPNPTFPFPYFSISTKLEHFGGGLGSYQKEGGSRRVQTEPVIIF